MNHPMKTKHLGQPFTLLDTVDSTNNWLKTHAKAGAPHGTVVLAKTQTAGRGRLGRVFQSPPESGLYFSVLLRPNRPIADLTLITIAAAVAVSNVVAAMGGCPALKWVNDVFLNGRKLCGILTESSINASGTLDFLIVGIGVNIKKNSLSPEIANIATSLEDEQLFIDPETLYTQILNQFEPLYEMLLAGNPAPILETYKSRLFLLNRTVTVVLPSGSYEALAMDVDETGGLVVEVGGQTRTLRTGEISVRG